VIVGFVTIEVLVLQREMVVNVMMSPITGPAIIDLLGTTTVNCRTRMIGVTRMSLTDIVHLWDFVVQMVNSAIV
jgi:hypothetical protein